MSQDQLNPTSQKHVAQAQDGESDNSLPAGHRPKRLTDHQRELHDLYIIAKAAPGASHHFPNPDSIRRDLVRSGGQLQKSFLLPNGEQLGKGPGIGLPSPCNNPKLHEICYSPKDKGFWLRFTGDDKTGQKSESWVLVSEDKSGREAIKSFAPHQKELHELYQIAKKAPEKAHPFPNPDSIRGDLVGPSGVLQTTFLLPNGEQLGQTPGIRLPSPCLNPKLHEIRYSPEDKGFWLRFTGEDKNGQKSESWVLVSEDKSGREAITTSDTIEANRRREELRAMYRKAREAPGQAHAFPNPDSIRGDLVGPEGKLQTTFLLPNGEQLGKAPGIGLSNPCINPKLHEIRYSSEDKGFWLRFTGEDKTGQKSESWVLISEDKSGREAITTSDTIEANRRREELRAMYQKARGAPGQAHAFPNPDSIRGDLVGPGGGLQISFLLPNGEQLGKGPGIGLPRPCINPKFHEIRYCPEEKGFWIRVSCRLDDGHTRVGEFLVSDDPMIKGKEAICKSRVLGFSPNKSDALPVEFRDADSQDNLRTKGKRSQPREAATKIERRADYDRVTFVKGEAFEQLIGVVLALTYPEERIVPQYCLKVGVNPLTNRGFYGMRVDYRIGARFVEVKWGGATDNILETYNRHRSQLESALEPKQIDYELIMLQENPAVRQQGVPYTLFSTLIEGLDEHQRKLVQDTQAIIASLVNRGEGRLLEKLTDYLYSVLSDLREPKLGVKRQAEIINSLELLLLSEEKDLGSFFEQNAKILFNALEANFEWMGKLYSTCIDASKYYGENSDSFDVLYTFNAATDNGCVRLFYKDRLARDLAVAQECILGQTDRSLSDTAPIFDFGGGVRVAPKGTSCSDSGVHYVESLLELQEICLKNPNLVALSDEELKKIIAFAQQWVDAFPFYA